MSALGRISPCAVTFVVAGLAMLSTAVAAAPEFETRFQQAIVLAHDSETRQAGISALRELAAERPEAIGPRYELAKVLTWSRDTRGEGEAILRQLAGERPDRADVGESLAEVLSWSSETRPESIAILRRITGRHPERSSTRLRLAEVLSWSSDSRAEAEQIYRNLIEEQPDSAEARIGLARLLSWRGEFAAARSLYESALGDRPDSAGATIGMAQILGWTGRPLASLARLERLRAEEAASPDAIKARGEAFEGLGLDSRAAVEYERLLSRDPLDPWARRRAERLADRLRPRLTLGVLASTESGDPSTSRLRWTTFPLELRWHPVGDLRVSGRAETGSFRNRQGATRRLSTGLGLRAPVGRRVSLVAELGLHDLEQAGSEWSGEASVRFVPADRIELSAGFERDMLTSSRLSAVGEEIGGVVYGPAVVEELRVGVSSRLGRYWDAGVRGASGTVAGSNLAANDRSSLYGTVGRRFRIRDADLRGSYIFYKLDHDLDLGGFPPAALGADGLTSPGVGGYFSPFRFRNQMVQLDAAWSRGERLDYFASGAIGYQQVEDAAGADFGDRTTSSHALFIVSWRATERLIVRSRIERQDVADAFDRTGAGVDLIILF